MLKFTLFGRQLFTSTSGSQKGKYFLEVCLSHPCIIIAKKWQKPNWSEWRAFFARDRCRRNVVASNNGVFKSHSTNGWGTSMSGLCVCHTFRRGSVWLSHLAQAWALIGNNKFTVWTYEDCLARYSSFVQNSGQPLYSTSVQRIASNWIVPRPWKNGQE